MKYAIALRNTKTGCMELTNIEFKSKKKALEWKSSHDSLNTNVECAVYQIPTDWTIGNRIA